MAWIAGQRTRPPPRRALRALPREPQRGIAFERQVLVPISYKGVPIEHALRLDLVVQGSVIVECKAVALWNPLFEYQLLTYLRVTGRRLGLAINFGERLLKDGIRRVINGYL